MSSYQSAVLLAPNRIEIQETTRRRLKRYECAIRVEWAGVCGTDLALVSGQYPVPLPLVPGHEFAGVVQRVGDAQFSDLIGRPVTAEINNTCLAKDARRPCAECRAGRDHHCSRRSVVGIINSDGAFAEEVVVPARNVHRLPRSWSTRTGVMVEPLAAAIQTFEKSPLRAGESVVVLGAGRLGLLTAIVAKKMGARVLAICRSEATRQRARQWGVRALAIADADDVVEACRTFTRGKGADIVVEATGDSASLGLALRLVRPEGAIAVKSTPGAPARGLDLTRAVVDEVSIQGSRCGPFDKAIRFVQHHKLDLSTFITDEFPLERIDVAFRAARKGGKVAIRM